MATRLKSKSFQKNLLLSVGGLFLLFAVCFSVYQYRRERQFKTEILDARLQAYCYEMVQSLGVDSLLHPSIFNQYVRHHPIEGLRITIINRKGEVLLDSSKPVSGIQDNHLYRKEIAEALRNGKGHDIKRKSASTNRTYFYSAIRFGDIVVRAAAPYSAELTQSLQADNTYLYFALTLTLLLGMVLYLSTSRIGKHIEYLREFAVKAEQGEELDHELERSLPDDELGDISHTIITLYWKLRHSEEDKVRLKRQLTQNAAHELKTPATSIHGYLESLLENPDMPDDRKKHFLARCYAQSERMNRLLLDMALLTKLDESPLPTTSNPADDAEVVDVAELLRTLLDEVSLDLERQGIKPLICIPEQIRVKGDRNILYSIFRNVIDNSITYATGADNITIRCTECGHKENFPEGDSFHEFVLSDNGPGVPAEHLPHLFERFYRIDKGRSRKAGGTGLGLAIVKNAVARYGGTTVAELTPGGGLTIRLTLKRAE